MVSKLIIICYFVNFLLVSRVTASTKEILKQEHTDSVSSVPVTKINNHGFVHMMDSELHFQRVVSAVSEKIANQIKIIGNILL